jgi:hypothetical protein
MVRSATHRTFLPAASLLAVVLCLPVLAPSVSVASDDGSCVGSGEYKAIKVGMTIEKLGKVLHGQTPFATIDGRGKTRYRWYFACEAWEPDRDVVVRYHQPVVGRRTVSKKALDVYVAPA